MMPPDFGEVQALIQAGRFRDALGLLQSPIFNAGHLPPYVYDVTLGELLLRTGNPEKAAALASKVLNVRAAPKHLHSRCCILLGDYSRLIGDGTRAIREYQKALSLATQTNDLEQQCWAELRLMRTIGDSHTEAAGTLLKDLRRHVVQLGDPYVVAALHLFVGQMETQRGLIDNGRRHLRIADSILSNHPNLWLQGTAAIDATCIAYLSSRISDALAFAAAALKLAKSSGYALNRTAVMTNLGHLHLLTGQLDTAESFLNEALAQCVRGGQSEAAILDGLARIRMQQNRLDDADQLLHLIEKIAQSFNVPPYEIRWSLTTHIKLLVARCKIQEAAALIARTLGIAALTGDGQLELCLKLLRAEVLLAEGRFNEAHELILSIADEADGVTIETFADIQRVYGLAFFQQSDRDAASDCFERCLRAATKIGTAAGRIEAATNFLYRVIGEGARAKWTEEAAECRTDTLKRVTFHPDGTSAVFDGLPSKNLILVQVAALFDQSAHPELMSQELFSLILAADCISEARLLRETEGDSPELIACSSRVDTDSPPTLPSRIVLDLGTDAKESFRLVVIPRNDFRSRTILLALKRIVKAVLRLETIKKQERERAALWPVADAGGTSDAIFAAASTIQILESARKIGPTTITVLITGQTGTGKEVLARAIHHSSPRTAKPFVPFNCTAVPRDMLDSQLFGHRRGAFTGAHEHFPGVIRAAAGGTLFLDEIGELGLDVQPKLLRFLESGEIHPLGEAQPVKVDVRVIAATNVDLDQLVADGRFREDLFYRLNVIRFKVPPLRERREEIPLLVQHFLRKYSEEFQKDRLRVAEETMEYLLVYHWPGNVRQLANELRRIVALAEPGAVLMPEHLAPEVAASRRTVPASERDLAPTEVVVRLDQPLAAAVEHIERASLQYALKTSGGRVEPAAKLLGLSRKGLYLKRHRLGLQYLEAR